MAAKMFILLNHALSEDRHFQATLISHAFIFYILSIVLFFIGLV